MKKIIAFLFLIITILAFASCEKEEANPYVGTWKDVFNKDTVIFNEDGTGKFGDYNILSWIQEENKIKAEIETMFLPINVEFEITNFGGEIVLSETPNGFHLKYLLIKSDKYNETAINNVKQSMLDQCEEWEYYACSNAKLNNEVKAKLEYDDKLVKWTAKVDRIENGHCILYIDTYNGLPLNAVEVFLSREELATLAPLDTITVVGFIEIGSIHDQLFAAYVVENHGQQ